MLEHNTCLHTILLKKARRQGQVGGGGGGGGGPSPSTPARQTLAAVAGDAAKVNLVACVRTPCIYVVLYSLPSLVLVVVHSFVTVQQLCSQSMCALWKRIGI